MLIVDNMIIKEFTHIEIFFCYKDNRKEISKLEKQIFRFFAHNLKSFPDRFTSSRNLSIREKENLDFYDFFETLYENPNLDNVARKKIKSIEKLIDKKVKKINNLKNELSEKCYAVFCNLNTEINQTQEFDNKELLFDWLHTNEIVPSNSFKELKLKGYKK